MSWTNNLKKPTYLLHTAKYHTSESLVSDNLALPQVPLLFPEDNMPLLLLPQARDRRGGVDSNQTTAQPLGAGPLPLRTLQQQLRWWEDAPIASIGRFKLCFHGLFIYRELRHEYLRMNSYLKKHNGYGSDVFLWIHLILLEWMEYLLGNSISFPNSFDHMDSENLPTHISIPLLFDSLATRYKHFISGRRHIDFR